MSLHPGLSLLVMLLLMSGSAWAQTTGIEHYEYGDYEAAARLFEQELADPQRPPGSRALTRIYLAASQYALGQVEEARKSLELLAREHPEERVDPARFPPELVTLAEAIRQQAESERRLALRELELRKEREEARRAPRPIGTLRPEVFGLFEAVDRQWTLGGGVTFRRDFLEGGVRVLLGNPPAFQLQGGVLPGHGATRPFLGLRASLLPGIGSHGAGLVAGGRLALPAGLVGIVELGADYFFTGPDDRYRFAITAQAGLGFDLHLR